MSTPIEDYDKSVLNEYDSIDIEKFEFVIGTGAAMKDVPTLFNKSWNDMDQWCVKTYGVNFEVAFKRIRMVAARDFINAMKNLGYRGNNTAISILKDFLTDQKTQEQAIQVSFINNVPKESKESEAKH